MVAPAMPSWKNGGRGEISARSEPSVVPSGVWPPMMKACAPTPTMGASAVATGRSVCVEPLPALEVAGGRVGHGPQHRLLRHTLGVEAADDVDRAVGAEGGGIGAGAGSAWSCGRDGPAEQVAGLVGGRLVARSNSRRKTVSVAPSGPSPPMT